MANYRVTKILESLDRLECALTRLQEAVRKPMEDDLTNVDATIQRFEFSIELFWKFLQKVLAVSGVEAAFPKVVLQKSYAGKLIDDEKVWIRMIDDRNLTSHTYDQALAVEMFDRIEGYLTVMQRTLCKIKKELDL